MKLKKLNLLLCFAMFFGQMDFKQGPLLRFLFLWDMMPHHQIINLMFKGQKV